MSAAILPGIVVVIIVGGLLGFRWWRRPRQLDKKHFQGKWKDLQKLCIDKKTWPQAIVAADALLDEALKKSRVSGKSMGERLVKAQRILTDNDGVWYGHKLRNKIDAEPSFRPKEVDIKQALIGIRQALKDLGALPSDQPKRT
jgi:hypothetical protein